VTAKSNDCLLKNYHQNCSVLHCVCIYAFAQWEHYVLWSSVCLSVSPSVFRPLTPISRDAISLYLQGSHYILVLKFKYFSMTFKDPEVAFSRTNSRRKFTVRALFKAIFNIYFCDYGTIISKSCFRQNTCLTKLPISRNLTL